MWLIGKTQSIGEHDVKTHDPRQAIEDLRNHLAAHNRHLAFLFGAGTSSAINIAPPPVPGQKAKHTPLIPTNDGLTGLCREAVEALGVAQATAWTIVASQCEQLGLASNVENVLSNIRLKIDATVDGDSLVGLDRQQLCKVEDAICSTIASTASPGEDKIPSTIPQDALAAWVRKISRTAPLEIFTTNYDILFERSFARSLVPTFDGFVGSWHPSFYPECIDDEALLPGPKWVRLWKLHGSVNWHTEEGTAGTQIIRSHENSTGQLILPSYRKYDESRKLPYVAYMERLSRLLNMEHSLLVTCGYSFGDDHINSLLYGSLERRNTANIIALQFADLSEEDNLVQSAIRRSNLTVIGPNGGVISGTWGTWQLAQPIDIKTCSFMDSAFDSNASPEEEGSPAVGSIDLKGRVRIGDFNWFCRFLTEMGGEVP